MTTTQAADEAAVQRAIEHWNAGNLDEYLAPIYADDAHVHGLAPEPLDKCELRFTLSGRHDGPCMGVPATGAPITVPGITILHLRDGRCVERWTSADTLGLLVQIGAVPPPPA